MEYEIGREYRAVLNKEAMIFRVLRKGTESEGRPEEYVIRWNDGEEEWAYKSDMDRWTSAFRWIQEDEGVGRGGRREGAGRPSIGVAKAFKLNLEQEAWDWVDECVKSGRASSRADLLRQLIDRARGEQ